MSAGVLFFDAQSLAFISSMNADVSNTDKMVDLKNAVQLQLEKTLLSGAPISADAVHFWMDYHNDDTGELAHAQDFLYGPSQGTLSRIACFETAFALTDALAPLFTDVSFAKALDIRSPEIVMNQSLDLALARNAALGAPPPALAIAQLGASRLILRPGDVKQPNPQCADLALDYAIKYIKLSTDDRPPVTQALFDAMLGIDKVATRDKIEAVLDEQILKDQVSPSPEVLAAYRQMSLNGPSKYSLTTTVFPADWNVPPVDPAFTDAPPEVAGWCFLAMHTLLNQMAQSQPPDPALLGQLKDANAWAAAYVWWKTLTPKASTGTIDAGGLAVIEAAAPESAEELCKVVLAANMANGQNLNADALKTLSRLDPAAAEAISLQQVAAGLPPTNQLLSNGQPSDYNYTNEAQPTIRVDLFGMGSPQPVVGDIVVLKGSTGQVLSDMVTLTLNDIARGYVDVGCGTTVLGENKIASSFINSEGTYVSPDSVPLSIIRDTTGPQAGFLQQSGDKIWINFNDVNSAPLSGVSTPPPGAFSVTVDGQAVNVTDVIVDGAQQLVQLTLATPLTNPMCNVKVAFDPAKGTLVDVAGNASPALTFARVGISFVTHVATASMPAVPASTIPYVDPGALSMLLTLNAKAGNWWQALYIGQGLLPPGGLAALSRGSIASDEDIETLLWLVFIDRAQAIEDELREQIATTQLKNQQLGKLNTLLGTLNKMSAAVPSGAVAGDKLSDKVDASFSSLATEVNAAIGDAGAKLFGGLGTITMTTKKQDLDGAIAQLRGQIDSLGNNQQTEMLRLQSLTTRRNECYTIVSNFLEKNGANRKGIIENMR